MLNTVPITTTFRFPPPSIIFALILALVLTGCAVTSKEALVKKQIGLSADKKLEFDRVFFNEIWFWNQTSWRYGQPSGQKRQREFESMAEQGYLPAYVALKMFDFDKQTKSPDAPAFDLLRQAADAGDVSSACALVPIWAWNDIEGYPRDMTWAVPYIEQGTRSNHFACQEQMSALYRKKIIMPPDADEARQLLLRSAKAGYTHAFEVLLADLRDLDKLEVANLDRAMCWDVAASLYRPLGGINFSFYDAAARGAYPQLHLTTEQRTKVRRLAIKWQDRMKSAKVIMDIVNECLVLEGGVQ